MNFDDLNDEIGADDWLIPHEELTSRRVIKRTPRYTIYKADWFGDVLVYEPNSKSIPNSKQDLVARRQTRCNEQDELKERLNELCINISDNSMVSRRIVSKLHRDAHDQADSAYSSISSSPQFYNKKHEFQFPDQHQHHQPEFSSESNSSVESILDLASSELEGTDIAQEPGSSPLNSNVILNKNSFCFGNETTSASLAANHKTTTDGYSSADWFELNELRLVAHENFILFMGASVNISSLDADCSNQNTSLVMEMIKPKSVSLYNLLHASKSRPVVSPSDGFFPSNSRQQLLSIGDKLNICQQVKNAMTYLHDKNIVHGRLTSVNIYIETNQRVKISLIDHDEQPIASCDSRPQNHQKVSFNLRTLTYLSPELVKTIRVERLKTVAPVDERTGAQDRRLTQRGWKSVDETRVYIDSTLLGEQTDVYSFGTLLFELFEERFPFARDEDKAAQTILPKRSPSPNLNTTKLFDTLCLAYHSSNSRNSISTPHHLPKQSTPLCPVQDRHWSGNIKFSASELIFQIGSGQISKRNQSKGKCPALVDSIISACWSAEPHRRPTFKEMRFE